MNYFTEYATFWRRAFAVFLDIILFSAISTLLLYWIYGPDYYHWMFHGDDSVYASGQVMIDYVLPVVLTVLLWMRQRGTPGKLLVSCVVVDAETYKRISLNQALIRYFGYFVSILSFGLGFVWMLWDEKKQTFHDKFAGTVVVMEDEADKMLAELSRELRS